MIHPPRYTSTLFSCNGSSNADCYSLQPCQRRHRSNRFLQQQTNAWTMNIKKYITRYLELKYHICSYFPCGSSKTAWTPEFPISESWPRPSSSDTAPPTCNVFELSRQVFSCIPKTVSSGFSPPLVASPSRRRRLQTET